MWTVLVGDEFEPEVLALDPAVQDALFAAIRLIQQFGRPRVDTLKDSKHANMKELRFEAMGGVWRVAFAFDPSRKAILVVAGDKSGGSQSRFYKELIRKADIRFDAHLARTALPAAETNKPRKIGRRENRSWLATSMS